MSRISSTIKNMQKIKALTAETSYLRTQLDLLQRWKLEAAVEEERTISLRNLLEAERAELLARVTKIDALLHAAGRLRGRDSSPAY